MAKHITGIFCEAASISEGLDETWPMSWRPEATIGDAVDAGPAGMDHDVELLLLEVAELLGGDLADLVVAGEPAELEIDGLGLGLGEAAGGQEGLRRLRRWRRLRS